MPFDTIPDGAKLKPEPFTAHVSDQELDDFKALLKLSHIGPKTHENQVTQVKDYRSWGVSRDWLVDAKEHWLNKYDWRKTEDKINSFPNYTTSIKDDDTGFDFKIHFTALFSKKADAVPLLMMHGWPGSFLEFLAVLDGFRKKYKEDNLPFHLIVPSLPGYGYSNGPPLDKNFNIEGIARIMDKLMIGLGFGDGYITQGGDIGSFVSRVLVVKYDACKACHLNMSIGHAPENEEEAKGHEKALKRLQDFGELGNAYAREHGTRPATIGLVLASSPIAVLTWIGEKFMQWSDTTPPLDEILDGVTLYWFTESFPRSIYGYRQFFGPKPTFFHNDPDYYIKKPLGYSWHPEELAPTPVNLVKKSGNLVWFREHKSGGHFAAMEKPEEFVKDMEDFAKEVWPKAKSS